MSTIVEEVEEQVRQLDEEFAVLARLLAEEEQVVAVAEDLDHAGLL